MEGVQEITSFLYYVIISVGCIVKGAAIITAALPAEDKAPAFKKFRNLIIFFIVVISLPTVYELLTLYFGTL